MNLSNELVARIASLLNTREAFVPLHAPEFNGREREVLVDCIDTGWVSSVGSYVAEFEKGVARVSGCDFGVAVVNGTAALQMALIICGVEKNDEVLIPALTFVATANATVHIGAVPHFIDSAYDTLGICPNRLRTHLEKSAYVRDGFTWNKKTGRRISAVVPMHVFGFPVDIDSLTSVLIDWPMQIIEDAAESFGSTYNGRPCGSLGRVAAVSFNGNKIITTGGGGAIVTNDEALAVRAKHITTTAKCDHPWLFEHDEVGYNYRMPNINAALGVAQLEQLNERLIKKQQLHADYKKAIADLPGVEVFSAPVGSNSNNWLITLILDREVAAQRDNLLENLNASGIMTRPAWTLMHRLKMYQNHPRADLSQAIDLEARLLNVPSSAYLVSHK